MNKAMFLAVADKLDSLTGSLAELYDQSTYSQPVSCGTAHCIGGWAIEIEAQRQGKSYRSFMGTHSQSIVASQLLGLHKPECVASLRIFSPTFMLGSTPQQVAKRLREFVKAGRVRFRKSDFPLRVNS